MWARARAAPTVMVVGAAAAQLNGHAAVRVDIAEGENVGNHHTERGEGKGKMIAATLFNSFLTFFLRYTR